MTDLHTENARLRAALLDVTASLSAAISLLSRGSKKAAPSDKMFDQMVADYEASAERARATLATPAPDAVQEAAPRRQLQHSLYGRREARMNDIATFIKLGHRAMRTGDVADITKACAVAKRLGLNPAKVADGLRVSQRVEVLGHEIEIRFLTSAPLKVQKL